jgi:hypothetical protein
MSITVLVSERQSETNVSLRTRPLSRAAFGPLPRTTLLSHVCETKVWKVLTFCDSLTFSCVWAHRTYLHSHLEVIVDCPFQLWNLLKKFDMFLKIYAEIIGRLGCLKFGQILQNSGSSCVCGKKTIFSRWERESVLSVDCQWRSGGTCLDCAAQNL